MSKIYLGDEHPYVVKFSTHIFKTLDGKFEVRYRDFDTTKQEIPFDTKHDAEMYSDLLKETCGLIDLDYFGERLTDNEKFWNEL